MDDYCLKKREYLDIFHEKWKKNGKNVLSQILDVFLQYV